MRVEDMENVYADTEDRSLQMVMPEKCIVTWESENKEARRR